MSEFLSTGETNFNSIMVRLKDRKALRHFFITELFQFHYGTIKSTAYCLAAYCLLPFQFHYGTIKSSSNKKTRIAKILFQFHYGTIKRGNTLDYSCFTAKFQFHYGTIKSIASG